MNELPSSEQRPACSKCQTPMVRYNVPHTGDKEQAWRLACSCKHSAVNEVVPSKPRSKEDISDAAWKYARTFYDRYKRRIPFDGLDIACAYMDGLEATCSAIETTRDDARDAARYRWLREHFVSGPHSQHRLEWYLPRGCPLNAEGLDENLDSELPAVEPSPAHTTEQDFQHWLSYSGVGAARDADLRAAYYAGADVAPPKSAGCPTHGMEHFFEGMCIKCGIVPAVNGD